MPHESDYSSATKAEGLAHKMKEMKMKPRISVRMDEMDSDREYHKREKASLKKKVTALKSEISNFDRDGAADKVLKQMKNEMARCQMRMMEMED